MSSMRLLIDPTGEKTSPDRSPTPRPTTLAGLTVGLLDIAKARGDVYLDRIEQRLSNMGVAVRRFRKPTMAKIAPMELRLQVAAECQVVVEALAD